MKKKHKLFRPGLWLQLTAALIAMVALMLIFFWLLITRFLQPMYDRHINQQLDESAATMISLIDSYPDEISSRDVLGLHLSEDFVNYINDAIDEGQLDVSQCCIDMFDSSLGAVTYVENIFPCLIHNSDFGIGHRGGSTRDTDMAVQLRQLLYDEGSLNRILEADASQRQMVVGALSADGEYGILISRNLDPVSEAGEVMQSLVPFIAAFLLLVAVVMAFFISYWFTKPLTQLSKAARQMAEGDYDVRVPSNRSDEVGILAQDFNHMADEVKRSNQLQRELLANVSHDLRTPLTLIKGYAETVRDLTGDNPEKRTDQLNVIVAETDRLSGLVNSVMDLSKVSSGTDRPVRVNFDMAQLCSEVAERYEAVCEQNHWQLLLELDDCCMVSADPNMMERVLHNLLGNATHHIGEDGIFILRARSEAGGGCRVEVEDHGSGIKAEDLPYIFDRYYRSRSDSGKVGTGLGLTITKAILQSHGFRFGVNSMEGNRTVFWFIMDGPKEL